MKGNREKGCASTVFLEAGLTLSWKDGEVNCCLLRLNLNSFKHQHSCTPLHSCTAEHIPTGNRHSRPCTFPFCIPGSTMCGSLILPFLLCPTYLANTGHTLV